VAACAANAADLIISGKTTVRTCLGVAEAYIDALARNALRHVESQERAESEPSISSHDRDDAQTA